MHWDYVLWYIVVWYDMHFTILLGGYIIVWYDMHFCYFFLVLTSYANEHNVEVTNVSYLSIVGLDTVFGLN
jgi:hypothetical protein